VPYEAEKTKRVAALSLVYEGEGGKSRKKSGPPPSELTQKEDTRKRENTYRVDEELPGNEQTGRGVESAGSYRPRGESERADSGRRLAAPMVSKAKRKAESACYAGEGAARLPHPRIVSKKEMRESEKRACLVRKKRREEKTHVSRRKARTEGTGKRGKAGVRVPEIGRERCPCRFLRSPRGLRKGDSRGGGQSLSMRFHYTFNQERGNVARAARQWAAAGLVITER